MNAKYIGNELETQQYLLKVVEKVLGTKAALVVMVCLASFTLETGALFTILLCISLLHHRSPLFL